MGNKPANKSTQAIVMARVNEVTGLLLQGYTRVYIIQFAAKWNLSDRQIDDYIAMANRNLKEVNLLTLQDNQAIIVGSLWDLFRQARNQGTPIEDSEGILRFRDTLGEQRQILMSIAKLKGLDQMTVNHVIEDKRELSDLSDEELEAIIVDPCQLPES